MKCPILFSEKNKKNISKCRLLKILPRVLSVKRFILLLLHSWRLEYPEYTDLGCMITTSPHARVGNQIRAAAVTSEGHMS